MNSTATIKLSDFRVIAQGHTTRIQCRITSAGFPDVLWFDLSSGPRSPLVVDEPNWAAVALLYPAMLCGRNLVVEAALSPRLLHALKSDVQKLLLGYNPRLREIRVEAGSAPPPTSLTPERGVGTGFSAGVDSFATLHLYLERSVAPSLRITHLFVNNVGAFGHTAHTEEAFLTACARTTAFADTCGLGASFVNSNMDDVFAASPIAVTTFQSTHTLRNASAALLWPDEIALFLYSSAQPYSGIGLAAARASPQLDTASLDPILLPLLSTERLAFLSAGAGLSRAEKTALIASDPDAQRLLDVCVAGQGLRQRLDRPNCSKCWKCIRTMATLEAIGKLEDFETVFDVELYRARRPAFLRRLQGTAIDGNTIDQEVIDLMGRAGLPLPFSLPPALLRTPRRIGKKIRPLARKLKNRLRSSFS